MTQFEANHAEGLRLYYLKRYDEAVDLLARNGAAGGVKSSYFLAWLYENGTGVEQDLEKAAYWFRLASEQGDREAQLSYAMICALGKGMEEDISAACHWATVSYHGGNPKALQTLQVIRSRADGEAADATRAFQEAHRSGDLDEAARQLLRAAECGDANAQYAYAQLLDSGRGVEQNTEEAKLWFRDAAEQGHDAARRKLTEMLWGDEGGQE